MNKNLSDRQRMPDETKDIKGMKKDQKDQQRQSELLGHDKKKKTIDFDEGQKFTSDEDITKRRTA